jgi:membrane-associated phospholipid phosphatase
MPPWLAAQQGAIPPLVAISHEVYANGIPPVVLHALDTNPVAAMPSLHMAFPTVCTILVWRLWGIRAGAPMLLYTVLQGIGIIYLGEHYLVDVLAGVALAGVVASETYRRRQPRLWHLPQAMVGTASTLLATGVVYLLSVAL